MYQKILVINPGSTSTKVAVYKNRNQVFLKNIKHPLEEMKHFEKVADQFEFRKNAILKEVREAGLDIMKVNIVVGRGGMMKPMEGGVYAVNDKMIHDLKNAVAEHESNLGGVIAAEIAREIGPEVKAIIVDPICVDEMEEIARISGMPELPRKSIFHALNQRAVARTFAREIGKRYEEINVIVAHMGGGVSVGIHHKGRVIDVNNGLNGEGPMTPERTGSLPVGQLVELCYSGKYTKAEVMKKVKGLGGFCAYLGTNDVPAVEKMIQEGNEYAKLIFDAMAYQVAKEIGAATTVLEGDFEGILLTGGVAYSNLMTNSIIKRIKHLGPVRIYPGEGEMEALAMNGYMVLQNEIGVKEYV
jgi:butyrate kinase